MAPDELSPAPEGIPLVVDVDGTLIRSDLLHEATLQFAARHPLQLWRLAPWLARGKAQLKNELASWVDDICDQVPLRDEVVALIREAQAQGRPVYLASASHRSYVDQVARRIGGIAGVFATESGHNLSGGAKAARLAEAFSESGFDYAGNGAVDYPVWRAARRVLVVSQNPGFTKRVTRDFADAQVVAHHHSRARDYLRALRTHQWAKNVLVFLPTIAGHTLDLASVTHTVVAFVCFCMAASSAYVINDLLDLPGDRSHHRKRYRPFASGAIPLWHGPPMAAVLLAIAAFGALLLPVWFAAVLAIYIVTTLAYSLVLKRKVLIDVIVLAGLYTIRVLGGVAAVDVAESPWLLMFSLFLFLCLALVKRCSELVGQRAAGAHETQGRGYLVEDLTVLIGLAAAAGYGAVLVVALYIFSPQVQLLYRDPKWLWLVCPLLLYWVSRTLILAHRDALHDDPVVFALTDRVSWIVAALIALVIAISV